MDFSTRPLTRCCAPLRSQVIDEREAVELAAAFKALADPVRLQLVSIIANATSGEICTCDLPELVGRSQATVSHHLGILAKAGIVERAQRGKWAWFRIAPERLAALGAAIGTSAPSQ